MRRINHYTVGQDREISLKLRLEQVDIKEQVLFER